MIATVRNNIPRGALFVAFNVLVVLFVVAFLLSPVLGRFADRNEEISESAAQLAHFRKIVRSAGANKPLQRWRSFSARQRGACRQRRSTGQPEDDRH